jgi:hypothetical protein
VIIEQEDHRPVAVIRNNRLSSRHPRVSGWRGYFMTGP